MYLNILIVHVCIGMIIPKQDFESKLPHFEIKDKHLRHLRAKKQDFPLGKHNYICLLSQE